MEGAFFGLEEETVLQEALDDLAYMLDMFLRTPGENQDVIKVENYEDIQHVPKNIIHEGLKDCRSIGKSERHDQIFVMPSGRLELIPLPYPNKMVSIPKVQLREEDSSQQRFEVGTDKGERILVLNGDLVKLLVVDAWPKVSAFLLDKEEASCHWGPRRTDETLSQTFGNVFVHGCLLREGQIVQLADRIGCAQKEINATVVGMMGWQRTGSVLTECFAKVMVSGWDGGQVGGRESVRRRP